MIPTGPITSDVLSLGGDHKFTLLPNPTRQVPPGRCGPGGRRLQSVSCCQVHPQVGDPGDAGGAAPVPWGPLPPPFSLRLGQTLSVRGEVTDENIFSVALAQAVGQWPGAKLLDYACVESGILGKHF